MNVELIEVHKLLVPNLALIDQIRFFNELVRFYY